MMILVTRWRMSPKAGRIMMVRAALALLNDLRGRIDYDALVVKAKRGCVTRFLFFSSLPLGRSGMSVSIRKRQEVRRQRLRLVTKF